MTKENKKIKNICKNIVSKKTCNYVLKTAMLVALIFIATIAFIYIPLQNLNLKQNELRVEGQKVDRLCSLQANQQAEQQADKSKKAKKELSQEEIKKFVLQQYNLCIYYAGYDPQGTK